jgi:hypothetical protein
LLLFLMHQMSSAMFRVIAGLCRTMVVASTGGTFSLLIIFMLGGFIIPRTQITVNEFLAPRWAIVTFLT